jgi:hypothetical protein
MRDGPQSVTRRALFLRNHGDALATGPQFALSEACRHPLALGAMVKLGAQLGAGTSLADLDNSRCGSLIGCYGISERLFIACNNFRDFPEIVVNNHDRERLGFRTVEIRSKSRPDEIWGRSEMEGTLRKRSYKRKHPALRDF